MWVGIGLLALFVLLSLSSLGQRRRGMDLLSDFERRGRVEEDDAAQ